MCHSCRLSLSRHCECCGPGNDLLSTGRLGKARRSGAYEYWTCCSSDEGLLHLSSKLSYHQLHHHLGEEIYWQHASAKTSKVLRNLQVKSGLRPQTCHASLHLISFANFQRIWKNDVDPAFSSHHGCST